MRHSLKYLILVAVLGACRHRDTRSADSVAGFAAASPAPSTAAVKPEIADSRVTGLLASPSLRRATFNRKLIRTAELRIQVDDVTVAVRNANRIAGTRD